MSGIPLRCYRFTKCENVFHFELLEDIDDDSRMEMVISDLLKDFDKVRIVCPKCNLGSQYKVGRVRHNPSLRCPTCWVPFAIVTGSKNKSLSRAVAIGSSQ
jgi:hypothetical protein